MAGTCEGLKMEADHKLGVERAIEEATSFPPLRAVKSAGRSKSAKSSARSKSAKSSARSKSKQRLCSSDLFSKSFKVFSKISKPPKNMLSR